MLDKIIAAVCILISVAAWGWWWENRSEKKNDDLANEKVKNDKEDKSDI